MKLRSLLLNSVAGLSLLTSLSASATFYDSHAMNPNANFKFQAWGYTAVLCGTQCTALGATDGQGRYNFMVPEPGTDPLSTSNGDGTFTYAGSTATNGGADSQPLWIQHIAYFPAFDFESDTIGAIDTASWNLVVRDDGRVLSGQIENVSDQGGGLIFVTCFDWTRNYAFSFIGDPLVIDCATIDDQSPPAGVTLDSSGYFDYITCDIDEECGQFGKSVPVPLFASIALGLGLVGITFLTSRRKSVA